MVISCVLIFQTATGQEFDRKEQKCVICHAQWHENRDAENQLLPDLNTNTFLDGFPAIVSNEKMCLSCHDGYVADSREVFSSSNHRGNLDQSHLKVQGLPLGKEGKVYCGTCHTPHALKSEHTIGLAPFLRKEVTNSNLCLDCHAIQAQSHRNHPIHVQQSVTNVLPIKLYFGKNNTVECLTCHPIHGTQPAFGVNRNDRSELCSACHKPYFNIRLTDHDLINNADDKIQRHAFEGVKDVCAPCHSSHNGRGKAMWAATLKSGEGDNGYCLGCHSSSGLGSKKSFSHRGHPVSGKVLKKNIPELGIKSGDRLLCTTCHNPHQWDYSQSHQVGPGNEEASEFTSFLRLPDDERGQLCTACHEGEKKIRESDHSVVRDGFQDYFTRTGRVEGQCSACHNTHDPVKLKGADKDSVSDLSLVLCESCHGRSHSTPTSEGFNHPLGKVVDSTIQLPTNDGELTCVTCHDPHLWGTQRGVSQTENLIGNDSNSFLRIANWPEPGLCLACHADQKTVLETDHDLSDIDQNACSVCHSAHKAQGKYGILSVWDQNNGKTYNERFCFSCHKSNGIASQKIPEAWTHPQEYRTITPNLRGTGKWIDFPLFDKEKPNHSVGFIDCFTCHDTHKWSFNDKLAQQHSENDEGDFITSFLRNPSTETLCTDCHGPNTLWKYKYYHDPQKRKRY